MAIKASKTGKLVLTAVTGALLTGCGTTPLTSTGMSLGATSDGGYSVLATNATNTTTGCDSPYAIYVHHDFDESGSTNSITGSVHVNHDYKLRGNRNAIGGAAEVVGKFDSNNNKHQVKPVSSLSKGFPVQVKASAFDGEKPVVSVKGDLDLSKYATKGVIKPGIYIATGKISLSGKGYTGCVTLIAAEVHVSGNSNTLLPYKLNTLAIASQAHVSGNSNNLKGLLQVSGELQWSGHQNAFKGAIVTEEFKLSGSDNQFEGSGDSYCPPPPPPPPTSDSGQTSGDNGAGNGNNGSSGDSVGSDQADNGAGNNEQPTGTPVVPPADPGTSEPAPSTPTPVDPPPTTNPPGNDS